MEPAKHIRLMVISLLFLSFFLIYGSAEAEVTYLGEICIFFNNLRRIGPPPEPPTQLMKLGVLYYDNGYFVLNGNVGNVPTALTPVQGTGLIDGDTFVATLVSSTVNATNTSFTASHLALKPSALLPGYPGLWEGTMTEMTFNLTQPTVQGKVTTTLIYMMVCNP